MPILDRRTLIAGALSCGALAASGLPNLAQAATPASGKLQFKILRNGKPFGQYLVAFAGADGVMTVTSDVTMRATISGLTVFDYKLHCEETWKNGRFMDLQSESKRDRDSETVTASRTSSGIKVVNKAGSLLWAPDTNPLTHWNSAVLTGPMFNPQTGSLLNLTAKPMGQDTVLTASGAPLKATHWALRGESQIEDWYDENGIWAGLRAVFPDKSIVEYRRV